MNFDVRRIRADFPVLTHEVNGCKLVYLDSAASAQKPLSVIEAESHFYQHEYAAVHRGIHTLSAEATAKMEEVRHQVARFIHAASAEEIIFVRGTTEGINLVANIWGQDRLRAGDNLIITEMEHHANIVPWQLLAQRTGVELRYIPITDEGQLDIAKFDMLIDSRTRLLAFTHVSNVLGTVNPVKELITRARKAGITTLIDGAQAVMHQAVNVQNLGCDFYLFSGHKIYGPTGIGVLYGRRTLLDEMPPWEGGGSMIQSVSLQRGSTWNTVPWRFEAGSPNTAGIIGLGAALKYVSELGIENIHHYEQQLIHYVQNKLSTVPDLIIYGPENRTGVISFNLGKHHAYDVGSFLDQYGIAIRTGHHCAMPLMSHFGVSAMCRASFALYNTEEEADRLAEGLKRIHRLLN